MGKTPHALSNFAVYLDGSEMLGVADVTLPDLEYVSETISGAGIGGEFEAITPGQVKAMELGIKFISVTGDIMKLSAPVAHHLDLRGSVRGRDPQSGDLTEYPFKVVVKGTPKKTSLGKLEASKPMGNEATFAINYIKVWVDGVVTQEIDVLNMICVINGVDYMAVTRANLGK